MKECKSGQCDIAGAGELGASYEGTCSCGCGCASCSCGCGGKIDELLSLAKDAHHELLKQKMKAVFEAKIGKKMDKVAATVVSAALVYMKDKMAEKTAHKKFEEVLMDIFEG